MSSKTNNLTDVALKRDPLLSRTNHSSMFSSLLTNEQRLFCFKTSKIDFDLGHLKKPEFHSLVATTVPTLVTKKHTEMKTSGLALIL